MAMVVITCRAGAIVIGKDVLTAHSAKTANLLHDQRCSCVSLEYRSQTGKTRDGAVGAKNLWAAGMRYVALAVQPGLRSCAWVSRPSSNLLRQSGFLDLQASGRQESSRRFDATHLRKTGAIMSFAFSIER